MVRCRGSKVEPLIALSAPRIVRCGDFGHETVVKILTNMLCAVQDCAMGEVMMIAKKCGGGSEIAADLNSDAFASHIFTSNLR